MELEKLHPHVTQKKAADRTALAQKYLRELHKADKDEGKHARAPQTSHDNPKYLRAEATRDAQAEVCLSATHTHTDRQTDRHTHMHTHTS